MSKSTFKKTVILNTNDLNLDSDRTLLQSQNYLISFQQQSPKNKNEISKIKKFGPNLKPNIKPNLKSNSKKSVSLKEEQKSIVKTQSVFFKKFTTKVNDNDFLKIKKIDNDEIFRRSFHSNKKIQKKMIQDTPKKTFYNVISDFYLAKSFIHKLKNISKFRLPDKLKYKHYSMINDWSYFPNIFNKKDVFYLKLNNLIYFLENYR